MPTPPDSRRGALASFRRKVAIPDTGRPPNLGRKNINPSRTRGASKDKARTQRGPWRTSRRIRSRAAPSARLPTFDAHTCVCRGRERRPKPPSAPGTPGAVPRGRAPRGSAAPRTRFPRRRAPRSRREGKGARVGGARAATGGQGGGRPRGPGLEYFNHLCGGQPACVRPSPVDRYTSESSRKTVRT
jgi:hypothetical protein